MTEPDIQSQTHIIIEMLRAMQPTAGRWAFVMFVCALLTVAAAAMDMWTGIDAARANKERISSRGLRKTVAKVVDYLRVLLFALFIDMLGAFIEWYALPYCAMLCTLGVLLIEGKSVIENLKKKRSHASDIVEMAARIIECATRGDAEKIIEALKDESKARKEKGNG